MKIAGLQKVGLIDFPDRIAASIFLAGCNLECLYCHNRWMIRETDVIESMPVTEFLEWLGTRTGLLDGVCISGGEPTLHKELPDLLRAIRSMGFAIKLDTNGTRPQVLSGLLAAGLMDYVALDVKAPLDARYDQVAGCKVDIHAIRESICLTMQRAPEYELRTTVGPQLDEAALRAIAREVASARRWVLQPYRPAPSVHPSLLGTSYLSQEALATVVEELKAIAPGVRLRAL